jgi:hypothetical protein
MKILVVGDHVLMWRLTHLGDERVRYVASHF